MVEVVLHLVVLRQAQQVAVLHVEQVLWLVGGRKRIVLPASRATVPYPPWHT